MPTEQNPDNPLDFPELFEEHFRRIYRYFRIRVGEDELARDLSSETFLRAFDHRASYNPGRAPIEAWLFGIARNLLIDTYRQNARRPSKQSLETISLQGDLDPVELKVLRSERLREVKEAVQFLDRREQDVIALKFGGALTNREIAEIHGVSEANAAVILHRGIKKLRALLGAEGSRNG